MFLVPFIMYLGIFLMVVFVITQIIIPLYVEDLELFWIFKKPKRRKK